VNDVVNDQWLWNLGGVRSVKTLTNTYRRKDIKHPKGKIYDGKCWRGCDGGYCPVCSSNRQHKKMKEYIRGQDIIHEEMIG